MHVSRSLDRCLLCVSTCCFFSGQKAEYTCVECLWHIFRYIWLPFEFKFELNQLARFIYNNFQRGFCLFCILFFLFYLYCIWWHLVHIDGCCVGPIKNTLMQKIVLFVFSVTNLAQIIYIFQIMFLIQSLLVVYILRQAFGI